MSTVERAMLLQRLLAIEPGTSPRDSIPQTSCFCLRKGWAYSFNQELAAAAPSGLDSQLEGAVPAKQLLSLLRATKQSELDVSRTDTTLVIRTQGEESEIPIEPIKLKIDAVERPGEWQPLDQRFSLGVNKVIKCTRKAVKRREEFAKCCIHIAPQYLEGSDNRHAARFEVPTFVSDSVLVRGTTIAEMTPLGFTQGNETSRWLHFRNRSGLRFSVRKFIPDENYPDLTRFYELAGEEVNFPKQLKDIALRAGLFADEETDGKLVTVSMSDGEITIQGKGVRGRHFGRSVKSDYAGKPLRFRIAAELLGLLTEQTGIVQISNLTVRVAEDGYVYVSSIGQVS
jgi:hypothetical protein